MPNVTPAKYRAMYELYPNKICIAEESWQCQTCITGRVASIGRPISKDHGHSLKAQHDVNVATATGRTGNDVPQTMPEAAQRKELL